MWESFIGKAQSTDFEDDYGTFLIEEATYSDENLNLDCSVSFEDDESFPNRFRISCANVFDHQIKFGFVNSIQILEEHVLLWPFNDTEVRLGFRGSAVPVEAVLGSLYQKHHEILGNWFPLDEFMNSDLEPKRVLESGFGVLAEGPLKLLTEYKNVLEGFGISTSVTGHRKHKHWNGSEFLIFSGGSVLILDDTYIVAEVFDAEPL